MKGQSLVLQFLLFFIIGLGLFLSIGGFFRLQSDIFREDIANSTRKLLNSYISSMIVTQEATCKGCDFVEILVKLENTTANYFYELFLGSPGLFIRSQPGGKGYVASIHNLNSTFDLSGFGVTSCPLALTKQQNKIEISCK